MLLASMVSVPSIISIRKVYADEFSDYNKGVEQLQKICDNIPPPWPTATYIRDYCVPIPRGSHFHVPGEIYGPCISTPPTISPEQTCVYRIPNCDIPQENWGKGLVPDPSTPEKCVPKAPPPQNNYCKSDTRITAIPPCECKPGDKRVETLSGRSTQVTCMSKEAQDAQKKKEADQQAKADAQADKNKWQGLGKEGGTEHAVFAGAGFTFGATAAGGLGLPLIAGGPPGVAAYFAVIAGAGILGAAAGTVVGHLLFTHT